MKKIDLSGMWRLDNGDLIELPGTLSYRKIGKKSDAAEYKNLTDPYAFEGEVFFSKRIKADEDIKAAKKIFLNLERTRISTVYVDATEIGSCDSFVAPHVYELTEQVRGKDSFELTIAVKNIDYKTPGGHMTSKDTQTNWLGILGEMSLYICDDVYIENISAEPDVENEAANIRIMIYSDVEKEQAIRITSRVLKLKDCFIKYDTDLSELKNRAYAVPEKTTSDDMLEFLTDSYFSGAGDFTHKAPLKPGLNVFDIQFMLGERPYYWSDETPYLYELTAELTGHDSEKTYFGLREFKANGLHFEINKKRTILRGKHDGMIFPMTGFAPMNVCGWVYVMKQAHDLGINHYRFHTCTPPDAAFLAADLMGIFMEPEIPFWGTFLGKDDEGYEDVREAQEFLRGEGFAALDCFSYHPSYCMMSMGNELWGNPKAIDELIAEYKKAFPNILFTQSSNGFQWTPNIQEHDDFFCGVRFSVDRQLRGSYAACDKPYGHVQISRPNTVFNYEKAMFPEIAGDVSGNADDDGYVEIQYGTGVKRVKKSDTEGMLIPAVPVVTHEIGQYCVFPKLSEKDKYTGVLKARYLNIIEEKLKENDLLKYAEDFFEASGALAAACYKDELESIFRTDSLAGFQLLDIQDFPGQDIALVGVLDALMENKGVISARDYRKFCSNAVIMAEFDSYIIRDRFDFKVTLSYFRNRSIQGRYMVLEFFRIDEYGVIIEKLGEDRMELRENPQRGKNDYGEHSFDVPSEYDQASYMLRISVEGTDIVNEYTLWSYSYDADKAVRLFEENKDKPYIYISDEENKDGISMTYSTDFWCYPMFKSISESMGRDIPEGTMGLFIRKDEPAIKGFLTREYTTELWYDMIMSSKAKIMDGSDIEPIVFVIDNFDRAHKLALIYEEDGKIYSTIDLKSLAIGGCAPAYHLAKSIFESLV